MLRLKPSALDQLRFLVMILILLFASDAHADCMESCYNYFDCGDDYKTGKILEATNVCAANFMKKCETQCATGPTVYGAIAFDANSTAWGLADDLPDEVSAQLSAVTYCSQHGTNCVIVQNLSNNCAAIIAGSNKVVTWAVDATAEDAQNAAITECAAKNGGTCQAKFSHCYFP